MRRAERERGKRERVRESKCTVSKVEDSQEWAIPMTQAVRRATATQKPLSKRQKYGASLAF